MSQSKVYFDRIGADWDRMRESLFPDRVRERALEIAEVQPGRSAADLGAGTGFITEVLLRRGLRVVAVDQSEPMLDALRAKFPESGLLDCRVGDAGNLPIDDASVSYCFANMFLHHVEDPRRAILEMARIVGPGGRVVVTDLFRHDHDFLRTEHHDRWPGFEPEQVERWFRAAGLLGVRVDDLGASCCGSSAEGQRASIRIFAASGQR